MAGSTTRALGKMLRKWGARSGCYVALLRSFPQAVADTVAVEHRPTGAEGGTSLALLEDDESIGQPERILSCHCTSGTSRKGFRTLKHEWVRVVRTERRRWHDRVYRGRVWFLSEEARRHRRFKQSVPAFLGDGSLGNLLTTARLIYSCVAIHPARLLGDRVPDNLLSDLRHRRGTSRFGLRARSPQACLSQRDRKGQLPLLHLRQRCRRLRSRGGGANGTGLVPHQARPYRGSASRSLSALSGLW